MDIGYFLKSPDKKSPDKLRARPPGPHGRFLTGVLFDLMADPLTGLQEAARYGDIVGLPVMGQTVYFLNHPDYIRHVLVDNARNYRKGPALNAARRLVGNGILASEGEFHTRQRRLASPAFHRQQVAAYAAAMVALTARHIAAWRPGEILDIHREMMSLTMAVVASCLYGADVTPEADRLARALSNFIDDFSPVDMAPFSRWLEKVPTPRQRRRNANARILEAAVARIISDGRAMGEDALEMRGGLLPILLEALATGEEGVTEQQVRDEVMTLFLAGQETTGPALSWTFYLLARHPEEEARLHAELEQVLDGREPTTADLPRLTYTRMVFSEALRLYPPAWGIGRRALAPDTIGGYAIPRGATVLMSQYVMQRNPAYWEAPDEFRPARFHPEAAAGRPQYTFLPFGGGHRMCLGEQFAWMEGTLIIATIAQRFQMRLAPQARIEPVARMSIRLKHGLPMILAPR